MVANETIKKKGKRRKPILSVCSLLLLCVLLLLCACTDQEVADSVEIAFEILNELLNEPTESNIDTVSPETTITTTDESTIISTVDGEMEVHFIDVGQSDATLFIHNGESMLFDAAMASRGDELVAYIMKLGIERIDVLVLSHPHDDHMGGAAELLSNIKVDTIYGPDIFDLMDSQPKTPGWYDDMIEAVDAIDNELNQGIPEEEQTSIWHFPRNDEGEFARFNIGGAVVEFLAPLEDEYSDKNDYSICAKITYGDIDIMMTADATSAVEHALIAEGYDLDIEIFQASHHGSDTGNSREFLDAMTPDCIVISCGMKNRYNHPIKSVMELYKSLGIIVYRTDESGNIVMTTDGTTYSFNVDPGTYISGAEYKSNGG